MPEPKDHVSQARRNFAFLSACKDKIDIRNTYPEWHVVVSLYTCLHIVEAILAKNKIHCHKHQERHLLVSTRPEFGLVFYTHYVDLYNLTMRARYLSDGKKTISPNDLRDCDFHFDEITKFAKDKYGIEISA